MDELKEINKKLDKIIALQKSQRLKESNDGFYWLLILLMITDFEWGKEE